MSLIGTLQDRSVTFLLVDDHEMYRLGLRQLIETQEDWRVVGEASGAEDALRLAAELRPKIAILDLRLKEGEGLDAVRRMHAANPKIKILVSSVSDEKLYADKCLYAGASGYVEKGAAAGALVEAVEKLLSGGIYLSPEMTDYWVACSAGRRDTIRPLDRLTPREREVYAMIGSGQSVKQIAGSLSLSAKTVEYHRQQMKKKLQLPTGAALARHAMIHPLEVEEAVSLPSDQDMPGGSSTDR